jgi:putative ABC transport system permease protein
MLREFRIRLRFLVGRKGRMEVDEEFQFHLERQIDANIAVGMTTREARRQAMLAFGGIERAREECNEQRPGWWVDTLKQDVRYAARGFRRNPVFAITVIVTLALGIGATTAVFSVVDRILFRSLPYADDDRLVSVGLSQPLERQEFTLGGFFFDWKRNQKPFASVTYEHGVDACNLTEADPVHLVCAEVAGNFLPTLGITPILGRNFLPEEDLPNAPRVALISDGLWLSRYNRDPGVVNKTIMLDGHSTRIIGVLPPNFEMPRLQAADIVVPAQLTEVLAHTVNSGLGWPMWAFARLKPGVSIAQAKAELQPLFLHTLEWIPAEIRKDFHLQVRSIRDRQMQADYTVAWVLLGAVLAVLLIACANVASLFSARGAARERELAVRSALGASRGRLMRQTMTEAVLLAVAGAVAGCVLAELLLRVFVAIAPTGLPFLNKAQLDLRILLFAVVVSLICALLFGTIPALQKPRATALAARQTKSGAHARLRRGLVAAQIGVSVVLLCGASLLLKSFRNLQRENLGMQTRDVLTVHVPLTWERYPSGQAFQDFYLRAEAGFRRIPGVTAVGMTNSVPPAGNSWHDGMRYAEIYVPGKARTPPGIGGTVVTRVVTPEYFRVLQIPILEGPGFREEDRNSGGDFIVLSKLLAARLFPAGDAVGQHIRLGSYAPTLENKGPAYTVAGVAGDVKNEGLAAQGDPELYVLRTNHNPDSWNQHQLFFIETALPTSVVSPWIRSQLAKLDPTAPVEIGSLHQDVIKLADRPRFESALLGFFAGCGLLMAIIGLYGVISYVATQRTQEIGVRMALGATRTDILRLIAMEGLRLTALGGALGLAGALATSQLFKSLIFNVGPRDPATYFAVAVLIAIVALAATLVPAIAAMKVEPVVALRDE